MTSFRFAFKDFLNWHTEKGSNPVLFWNGKTWKASGWLKPDTITELGGEVVVSN